jgi:hypothetical protein
MPVLAGVLEDARDFVGDAFGVLFGSGETRAEVGTILGRYGAGVRPQRRTRLGPGQNVRPFAPVWLPFRFPPLRLCRLHAHDGAFVSLNNPSCTSGVGIGAVSLIGWADADEPFTPVVDGSFGIPTPELLAPLATAIGNARASG